ncbi:MAG: RES family NAD+ phosphorylase [Parafilimonas sp.]
MYAGSVNFLFEDFSENRALCVLEYSVNVNIENIPRAFSITSINVPENNILELKVNDLPGNWQATPAPAPASTKDFGTVLLKKMEYAIIKIPSAIIPAEYNYILNPLHKASASFSIQDAEDFIFDTRIKFK